MSHFEGLGTAHAVLIWSDQSLPLRGLFQVLRNLSWQLRVRTRTGDSLRGGGPGGWSRGWSRGVPLSNPRALNYPPPLYLPPLPDCRKVELRSNGSVCPGELHDMDPRNVNQTGQPKNRRTYFLDPPELRL